MSDVTFASVTAVFVARVNGVMADAAFTALPFYDADTAPQDPPDLYAIGEPVTTGVPWTPTLLAGQPAGTAAVQVTGVGLQAIDALAVLDHIRRFVTQLATGFPVDSTTACRSVWSTGPPSTPIREGGLQSATETYHLYLEAI